jgi:hypothetical protein
VPSTGEPQKTPVSQVTRGPKCCVILVFLQCDCHSNALPESDRAHSGCRQFGNYPKAGLREVSVLLQNPKAPSREQNGSTKSEFPKASQHDMGWRAQRTAPLLPVAGDVFSLDSPLYRTRLSDMSYKRECQETTLSVGSVPILFCLGIQPNCLNVHPQSESGLPQAECPVSSPCAKRRYASSPLWFHTLVAAPFVF